MIAAFENSSWVFANIALMNLRAAHANKEETLKEEELCSFIEREAKDPMFGFLIYSIIPGLVGKVSRNELYLLLSAIDVDNNVAFSFATKEYLAYLVLLKSGILAFGKRSNIDQELIDYDCYMEKFIIEANNIYLGNREELEALIFKTKVRLSNC